VGLLDMVRSKSGGSDHDNETGEGFIGHGVSGRP
jgi:hypothetical protein